MGRAWQHGDPSFPYAKHMKIALVSPYDYPFPGGVTEHISHLYA